MMLSHLGNKLVRVVRERPQASATERRSLLSWLLGRGVAGERVSHGTPFVRYVMAWITRVAITTITPGRFIKRMIAQSRIVRSRLSSASLMVSHLLFI